MPSMAVRVSAAGAKISKGMPSSPARSASFVWQAASSQGSASQAARRRVVSRDVLIECKDNNLPRKTQGSPTPALSAHGQACQATLQIARMCGTSYADTVRLLHRRQFRPVIEMLSTEHLEGCLQLRQVMEMSLKHGHLHQKRPKMTEMSQFSGHLRQIKAQRDGDTFCPRAVGRQSHRQTRVVASSL